jgi:hypothetical protein
MNAGDLVANRFDKSELFLVLNKFNLVDEPAWFLFSIKERKTIWFYEHDLKKV